MFAKGSSSQITLAAKLRDDQVVFSQSSDTCLTPTLVIAALLIQTAGRWVTLKDQNKKKDALSVAIVLFDCRVSLGALNCE